MKKTTRKGPAAQSVRAKKEVRKGSPAQPVKSLVKQYLKKANVCRVTFRLPKQAAPDARVVTIVGDFNNWSITETKMERLKTGDFKYTIELPCNREYRFRYLIDSNRWENDWFADKYVPNQFGCDDSVVCIASNGA